MKLFQDVQPIGRRDYIIKLFLITLFSGVYFSITLPLFINLFLVAGMGKGPYPYFLMGCIFFVLILVPFLICLYSLTKAAAKRLKDIGRNLALSILFVLSLFLPLVLFFVLNGFDFVRQFFYNNESLSDIISTVGVVFSLSGIAFIIGFAVPKSIDTPDQNS